MLCHHLHQVCLPFMLILVFKLLYSLSKGETLRSTSSPSRHEVPRALLKSNATYARGANKCRSIQPTYQVGHKVWLSTRDLPLRVESCRMVPRFNGHLPITKVTNPVAVHLQLSRSLKVHPTSHVLRLKPFLLPRFKPSSGPPPLTRLIDGSPAYTIRRLLHTRWWGRGLHYLVDWEGYSNEECSWVPACHILEKTFIRTFQSSYHEQTGGPSGAGP